MIFTLEIKGIIHIYLYISRNLISWLAAYVSLPLSSDEVFDLLP